MTREEAIEAIKCNWPDSRYTILREALDMAISALRQQEHFRDLTKKVEPMTLDDAIAHLDDTLSDTGRKWSCESCRMEHVQLRAWLDELRYIKRKRNAPLTLDELRKMDETVWVCYPQPTFGTNLLSEHMNCTRCKFRFADYGKTWLAYRQKPEEDDHGV